GAPLWRAGGPGVSRCCCSAAAAQQQEQQQQLQQKQQQPLQRRVQQQQEQQQQQQLQQQQQQRQGFATASFGPLGLLPSVQQALQQWGILRGSSMQAAALPLLLQGQSLCIAAETGSGKTLAYVVALVQRLLVLQQQQQQQT
ncbi:hypothetical protein ETH_00036530, partial [Eimeria tenella]